MSAVSIARRTGERTPARQRLLWALAALIAMLMPAMDHIRPWAAALIAVLIVWRLGHAWFNAPLPGRALRAVMTLGALAAIWFSYGTLLGIVAGSALLVVMAGLKLIESHSRRDYFLLLVITLFIGLADFLYKPNIELALYMLPALWLTVTAFVVVGDGERGLSGRQAGRIAAGLLIPAAPIAAILFFIFPRVPGPIWQLPSPVTASTGIGDTMSPGSISQLVVSNRIAFRVHFDSPPPHALYWRGPVLHHFQDGIWTRGNKGLSPGRVQPAGAPLSYTITLQPDDHRWLYALATPLNWPSNAALAADYTLYGDRTVRQRERYRVTSYPDARYGLDLPPANRQRDLQLPPTGNPRARALAARWRRNLDSPQTIVKQALDRFANGAYYYTLKPPPLAHNGIDKFLFETRRGFCGHYASALVFLMRAAGIPAHVVTGYVGGERNPIDGYWTIRDARAHAWAEVWLAGVGWKRIDPTAVLPPNRISPEAAAAIAAASTGGAGAQAWLRRMDYVWNAANTFWNEWVMSYGPSLQRKAFARLGIDYGDWVNVAMTMLVAFVLIFAGVGAWFAWRTWLRRGEPVVRLYERFCRKLARVGLHRRRSEGPLDFASRAARRRPDCAETVDTVTGLYVALRYGVDPPADGLRRMAAEVANFQPERRV
ncbi:MAG TPA: DUF3488 and transglutaminase-like domain-containing protein [Gammaproteobacteria bacterium]|nr:DUF3488 and transglutaminase-like domain-containing protein [Gammaproteobacteria bacterium]